MAGVSSPRISQSPHSPTGYLFSFADGEFHFSHRSCWCPYLRTSLSPTSTLANRLPTDSHSDAHGRTCGKNYPTRGNSLAKPSLLLRFAQVLDSSALSASPSLLSYLTHLLFVSLVELNRSFLQPLFSSSSQALALIGIEQSSRHSGWRPQLFLLRFYVSDINSHEVANFSDIDQVEQRFCRPLRSLFWQLSPV